MKKLALVALVLAAAPLLVAAAPGSVPAAPEAVPSVAPLEMSVPPAAPTADSAERAQLNLETVFTEIIEVSCIDSDIPCTSPKQCISVCQPLVCVCNGTCQYCP